MGFAELERWDVSAFTVAHWAWPPEVMHPLACALKRVVDEVPVTLERRNIPIIEKITFGGELLITEPSDREGYKGRLYWARSGEIIYSKIRVKQGSITVVPAHVASVAVSAEYPVFAVAANVARADYLQLVLRCSMFQLKLDGLSHGGSTKTRIHPEQFGALEIPLPPLPTQQAIVRRWQAAQTAAEGACHEAQAVEHEAAREFLHGLGLKAPEETKSRKCFARQWGDMGRWGVMSNRSDAQGERLENGLFPVVDGETCIAEIIHGCSVSPSPIPTALGVLKISAVTRGALDTSERKFAPDMEKLRKQYALRQGDVLLCRTNGTLAYVGQSALVDDDLPDLIFPDKVIRVRLQENMLPAYFWQVLQTSPLRNQIEAAARTAVGNYAIGGRDLWRLHLPLPPLPTQQTLVAAIAAARQRAAGLRAEADRLQAAAIAEAEAAILGKGADRAQVGGYPE